MTASEGPAFATLGLRGSVALVTGGSRGIGAASVLALASAGASVVFSYLRQEAAAAEVASACRRLGARAEAVRADAASEADTHRLFDAAEALGPIDTVVANAGIWEGSAIEETATADWQRMLEQNLTSAFFTCREGARRMKRHRRGSIVVISSTAGQRGEALRAAYAATKGGVISLVKALASELGPGGIRVNAVAPGWVMTDMSRAAIEADRPAILAAIPLRRVARAEDIAGPVLFLASELARHVTGEILNVNGGSVLCG